MSEPLSGSMVAAFQRCPRYFKHAHLDKRQPRDRDGNLTFGTAWHDSRAARWKGEAYTQHLDPANRIGRHEVALLKTFSEVYDEVYAEVKVKPLYVEQRLEVSLRGLPFKVKFDALVEDSKGRVYIVEHKTTSSDISPEAVYWERLLLDTQISAYWLAAESLGHKLSGVLYDVIRKPQLRKSAKETGEDFTERCCAEIRSDTEKYFARQMIQREPGALDNAYTDLLETTELVQIGKFPRNTRACFDWFRRCEYFDVCAGVTSISDNTVFEDSTYE